MKKFTLLALFFFGGFTTIYSQPGELDSTFGSDGIVKTNDYNSSVAIQDDEKIVVGGWNFLSRYTAEGKPDETFSGDGTELTNISINSITIQSDGKILVAGFTQNNGLFFTIARYNTEGTLDNSFSDDGIQTIDFASRYSLASSVTIQNDDKIVVAGQAFYNSTSGDEFYDFAVARLNIDGSLDNTFDNDGKLTTTFSLRQNYAYAVKVQGDNKIVVAGQAWNGTSVNFALARYNTDGSLDNTFGVDGKQTTFFEGGYSIIKSIAIQTDGKIVAGGYAEKNGQRVFALARYNTDGNLDASFSKDGKQITSFTDYDTGNSLDLQSDGKIVLAGSTMTITINDYIRSFALARYNNDGSLDYTFGNNGKQITKVSLNSNQSAEIASIDISNNKLYAVGVAIVARYLLDGESIPPTVSLSIPYNIVKYSGPARIKLNANVDYGSGKITKVRFYNGTTLLHTETQLPYGFLWINVPVGNYKLTAKAIDNSGNVTASNTLDVSVVEENVPPVVSIVNPVNNATYGGPATFRLIATAKDPNDKISKVELYSGNVLLRTEYYYPYTYTWTNVQAGKYTLTAVATDDKGLSATSAPVTATVVIRGGKPSKNNLTDQNSSLSLKLSPVPAKSTLQIYTNGLQTNKPSTMSVMSASGVVMKTIQSNTSNKVVQLDVSSLVSGVYTIKVVSGDKVMFKQFLKL